MHYAGACIQVGRLAVADSDDDNAPLSAKWGLLLFRGHHGVLERAVRGGPVRRAPGVDWKVRVPT